LTYALLCHNFETVRVRKSGSRIPVSLTISPVRDEAGRIIGASKIVRDIIERKKAEEALARSEQQARLIADATPALISYIDAQLRYRFVNREYELWFGHSRDSLLGKSMAEVMGPAVMARLRPYVESALAGREVHFETEAPFLEGAARWIEAHYVPDRDAQGNVVGFYVMVLDVTKRRRIEEALRESEQRIRATFDRAAVGIVELDANHQLVAVNDRLCQILGYERQELLGMHIQQLTAPEDRALSQQLNAQLHDRELETFSYEKRYLKRDGAPIWVHVAVSAVRDPEGRSLRHIGTVEDITDRKRAEQALRESEARYRTITEAMPHLVWSAGADGALDYINGKWTEYTGLSLSQSREHGWMQALHRDDDARVAAVWRDAIASQAVFNCDFRLRRQDGAYRWFKSWGVPLRNDQGQVVNWFGACTDIDDAVKAREVLTRDRDELERTVRERTAKLQEMVAELEAFSYSIAHDLRGPLRAMQGFADAVLEDYGDRVQGEGKDYLQRIKAAAARQDEFIRDMLNYSRLVRQELKSTSQH
jgi:PAS domain S-box-containing protein